MRRVAIALILSTAALSAQVPKPDKRGCADSKMLTRIPVCWISFCRTAEFEPVNLPVKDRRQLTAIEGSVEEIKYMCPASVSSAQVAGNAEGALKNSGYRIVFKDVYATLRHWITAQSGPQWVAVASTHGTYTVTTVRTKELEQVMQASADSWAQQIAQTGRVSIYGINFDTGRATIRPDSEKVLVEMAGLFQKNPEWYMLVGGHTDNTGGDDINVPLSHQRAEAVIQWLAGHGVEKARLVPAGFGAKKPLADNGSEDGRAKNRRVDLVKLY